MKQGLHPEYVETHVTCSCGNSFTTRSTRKTLHVELCNLCHPFYTGKQRLVDAGGRVERFQKKYAAQRAATEKIKAASAEKAAPVEREGAEAAGVEEAQEASSES